jgi:hypothetical protein
MITSGVNTNQVTVTWQTAGTRTITANYSNSNGCSAPDPAALTVNVSTAPDPEIYGDNDVCQGSTAVEYSTEPGFENYVWLVSPGGVIASGAGTNTITINWNTPGNHNVSVNYTNATGCSASQPSQFPVTVQPKPAAAGVITGPASVCSGSTGLSYSIEPVANALSYTWILPAGINITSGVGTNNITVTITSAATSGSIKVYANNYCGSGTLSPGFNLTVKPAPATPVITQHGDTLSSSATTGNQWYLDGVEIAGATLQQYVAVYAGNYTVIVTLDGCSSQPSEAIFVQPVGIKNVIINGFNIFPNPSNGKFTIEAVTTLTGDYTLEVYNTNGKLMLKEQTRISDATTRIPVDLGFVPNGVYQVVLRNATGTLTRKVLIMH